MPRLHFHKSWIFLSLCITSLLGQSKADRSYTVHSPKNKTIDVDWTVGSEESNHFIRCIAAGDPLPNLHWVRDKKNFTTGTDTITVDLKDIHNISIYFKKIDYDIIRDYHCVATNPNNVSLFTDTYFKVTATVPWNVEIVFVVFVVLAVFLGAVVAICRVLQMKDIK